jgi:hypothetical protein
MSKVVSIDHLSLVESLAAERPRLAPRVIAIGAQEVGAAKTRSRPFGWRLSG